MMALPADKVLHFAAGGIAAALGVLLLPWMPVEAVAGMQPAWQATAGAVWAALGREAYNVGRGGRWSWQDVSATLAGGLPLVAAVAAAQLR